MTGEVDRFVRRIMRSARIPGLSLGIAVRGRVRIRKGYGFRDLRRRLPATPQTVYGIASITKSFTALAVLQLEERGRLRIDSPVVRYLPEFATRESRWTRRIRIHHFLTHSSGLPPLPSIYYTSQRSLARDPPYDPRVARRAGVDPDHLPIDTYEQLMEYLKTERYRLLGPPGRYFSYSNEGFGLLGAIIERVTGQSYESYLGENVLGPGGLRHTVFDTGIMLRFPDVTTLYSPKWTGKRQTRVASQEWWEDTSTRACGALRTNLDDLLAYVDIFRTGGRIAGARIVSPRSLRKMTQAHIPIAPNLAYGYGVALVPDFHGTPVVFHSGGLKGVSSFFAVLPRKRIAGVALTNLDLAPAHRFVQAGVNDLLGIPLNTPFRDVTVQEGRPTDLRPYGGRYGSGEGIWAKVSVRKRRIRLDFHGIEFTMKRLLFSPVGPDEFVMRREGEKWSVRFERDDRGRIWAVQFGWRLVRRRTEREWTGAQIHRTVW